MQRLLVVVALLFGFAAVAAPAMAATKLHAPPSAALAETGAALCDEPATAVTKVVPRACAKKHKGVLGSTCHQVAVLPAGVATPVSHRGCGEALLSRGEAAETWPTEPQLRPPRMAVIA